MSLNFEYGVRYGVFYVVDPPMPQPGSPERGSGTGVLRTNETSRMTNNIGKTIEAPYRSTTVSEYTRATAEVSKPFHKAFATNDYTPIDLRANEGMSASEALAL